MPQFSYSGIQTGKKINGSIIAKSLAEAKNKLKIQKIIVTTISASKDKSDSDPEIKTFLGMQVSSDKLTKVDIMMFTKKLETMINADLPIMECLQLMRRQSKKPGMIKVTKTIIEDLNQGKAFSSSLDKFPQYFDDSYVNMVRAGESSGTLALFLKKIVDLVEKNLKIVKDIKGALTYPIILLSVAIGVTVIMLLKVVPVFQEIYDSIGLELPGSTQIVIGLSEFLQDPARGGVLFLSLTSSIGLTVYLNKKVRSVKKFFHGFFLKIPLFGELIKKSTFARISLVLANLLGAGVSIIESLEISSKVTNNIIIREAIERIKTEILTGKSLSVLFAGEKIFPMEFSEFMRVGEKTGSVDEMFTSIATYYEAEVDNTVGALKQFIEPVMIVFIGGLIAGLLLTLYQPIFSMGQVIQ